LLDKHQNEKVKKIFFLIKIIF